MRRIPVWITLLVFVLGACTGSGGDATTTTLAATTTTSIPATTTTTIDPALRLALPLDPDVVMGRLDNGLAYYVRHNDSPGGRAELRLLVGAGSVHEDDDQAGMAHFLEHMMFNGTERFPRNELIAVLEAFGPRFGPDINAHTSFDETVYELSLTTDDPELLELGVDVLREWASRATLTETDVTEERGVILDEWRLRAQGFGARVGDEVQRLLLTGTPYEGHLPIGNPESISSTSPPELRRYYQDWYTPDRMAVVAVGDFDVAEMESLIASAFGDLEEVAEGREFVLDVSEPITAPRVGIILDEEATTSSISTIWPIALAPMETVGDYQESVALSLGLQILSDRINEEALSSESPLLGSTAVDQTWAKTLGVAGIDVEMRPDGSREGVERVLVEIERMHRHGVTESEFSRALAKFTAASEQAHRQQESTQDLQYAAQISAFHLSGSHLMSTDQRFKVESDIAERLTREDLDAELAEIMSVAPAVLVVGPDDQVDNIPDEAEILAELDRLASAEIQPRTDTDDLSVELIDAPEPVEPASQETDPRFQFTTLTYENGATVEIWESEIAVEAVYALVAGFGGTSLVDVEDLPEVDLMLEIAGRSGLGEFDVPTLERLLAGQIVGASPWLSETRQGLEGSSASGDLETLFQLIYLTMTSPRFDSIAVSAVVDEVRALSEARDDIPSVLFDEAVRRAYYGENPRYYSVLSTEQLDDFDPAILNDLYQDLYGDASNFVFVFVGDFETDTVVDLASTYIGTLPGTGQAGAFVDNQPLPPRSVQVETVQVGVGEQGQIGMFFTNPFEADLNDRLTARLVELILSSRLRERIREELSATYSIQASVDLQRDPDAFAEASVLSTGDPAGLEQIADEVLSEIADLQRSGPTLAEFNTAVEQLRDELELIDNRILADGLATAFLYPDQPVEHLADRYFAIDELTASDVQALMQAVFDLGQRIEVRQVPRTQ